MTPARPLALLLALAAAASAGDAFDVKLDRPLKKGAKLAIEAKLQRVSDDAMGDQAEKSDLAVELKGTIEVTEVDAKGRIAKASCKIEKCSTTKDGGAAEETLPAGHVIALESKGGKLEVRLGKDGLDKHVAELLARFTPWEGMEDALCDDGVFGTADKKKDGDAWDLDGKKVVARLALARKEVMDAAKVKATAKLAGQPEIGGGKGLEVAVDISIPGITSKGHLAGFQLTDSGLTWKIRKTVPQSASQDGLIWSDELEVHQHHEGNMGGGKMVVRFKETTTRTITVKAAK